MSANMQKADFKARKLDIRQMDRQAGDQMDGQRDKKGRPYT